MGEGLELKAYSLVLYQLSGQQAAIQGLHATIEYGVEFGMDEKSLYYDWAKNWKTVIVLNGGTSNTIGANINLLIDNDVPYVAFKEPDLYNQITAISFIVDERVFDRVKYPDMVQSFTSIIGIDPYQKDNYNKWVESIGGEKNVFLRTWLPNFRLA